MLAKAREDPSANVPDANLGFASKAYVPVAEQRRLLDEEFPAPAAATPMSYGVKRPWGYDVRGPGMTKEERAAFDLRDTLKKARETASNTTGWTDTDVHNIGRAEQTIKKTLYEINKKYGSEEGLREYIEKVQKERGFAPVANPMRGTSRRKLKKRSRKTRRH